MYHYQIGFAIILLLPALTAPAFTVVRNDKDYLTGVNPACGSFNALGDVVGMKIVCRCGNGDGLGAAFHSLLNNKTPYCKSTKDLGCYVTIKDKKSGAVNSFKDFELVYPNSISPNQVQSYHFQIWNCDNESVSFWSNVENTFVEKYFTLEQDNLILRTRNLSIWQGHAIRIIFNFNDAGQPNQCLFIKVPGTLVYPAVITDIDASKASDVFVPPSVFIQPSSSSATYFDSTTTTTSITSDVFVPPSVFIQPSSSPVTSFDPTTNMTSITNSFVQQASTATGLDYYSGTVTTTNVRPTASSKDTSSITTPKVPTTPPKTTPSQKPPVVTPKVPTTPPETTPSQEPPIPSAPNTPTQPITIIPTTAFRNTTSPTEEPPVVNNAPVIAGVTTSLAFLLVFSAALFYVLRKKLKKRQTVLPDDQLVLDETHSTSSSITNKSLSSAHEVENEADEKKEPVQTDYVMEFKGVDEYD